MRTYDAKGETRCVAFDLDAKKGATRATVLRDCERLTAWLADAGCAYFVDESVSGGRHVYVVLDHDRSHAELAPLARNLRAANCLPTLDPGPLVNLTEGCIRVPGSAHRLGGHQQLVSSIAEVQKALNRPTTSAAWQAFLARLPEAPESRRNADLDSPAAGATPGPKRTLAPSYALIATTGTFDERRYPSASEARAAVLLHALCRGWSAAQITAEVTAGRWTGLSSLYRQHYGSSYTAKALAGDLTRATARMAELPLQGIHTSASRPRGVGGSAARTHLRRWAAALELAIHKGRWSTARSYSIELLLTALGDAARRSQTIYPSFGVRHLSMGTGTALDHSTVAKMLKALVGEDDPFVLLIDSDRGVEPDVYELRIPDEYLDEIPLDQTALPAAPIGIHPAFSLLPRPAYRLHGALSQARTPLTPSALAASTATPLRSVYATLVELERAGVAKRARTGGWTIGRRSLTSFARLNGIAARLRELVRKWRAERNALRALHGLEEIHYPGNFSVAWPGLPVATTTATGPPLTREQELHAADPPQTDWRTDPINAAIELLRQTLGAQLLETGPPNAATA